MIHPSATVDPKAQLAATVKVGANVVIEADVVVEDEVELLAGTILHTGSRIGKGCHLGPYAVVGGTPMDTGFEGETSYAVLEPEVILREFVTVHRASGAEAETRIGTNSLVMSYVHVSHNVQVGQAVVLTTSVQLGGHCQVGNFAFVGSTAILHQFCRVGAYAMYGAGSASNQDILPYSMVRGNPAKHYRLNKVGLERRGITGERYQAIERANRAIRRRDWQMLEDLAKTSEDARIMLEFKESSKRGLCSFI